MASNPTSHHRRPRAESFKLEVPGSRANQDALMIKLKEVKMKLKNVLQAPANNYIVLDTVLDYWLTGQENTPRKPKVSTHQDLQSDQTNQDMFVTCQLSTLKLASLVEDHASYCPSRLSIFRTHNIGHVKLMKLKCHNILHKPHSFWWASSPKLPNNSYLVNERIHHGLAMSGMRPSHYTRIAQGSGIGIINKKHRGKYFNTLKPHIDNCYEDSIETALHEEVAWMMCEMPTIQ